jgi:hypothetical protein
MTCSATCRSGGEVLPGTEDADGRGGDGAGERVWESPAGWVRGGAFVGVVPVVGTVPV